MRSMSVVVLLLCLTAFVANAQEISQTYDMSLTQNVQPIVNGTVTSDVVMVHAAGGPYTLDNFMSKIVPASLRATGALPAPVPAPNGTLRANVVIPCASKSCHIVTPDGKHPLWLRVRATKSSKTSIKEDSHERWTAHLCDPWSYESYFITEFTAVCRVTKYHKSKTSIVKNVRKTFHWVDP